MITMSHRALPRYVACVAFVALTASAWAQAPVHLESDAGWSRGASVWSLGRLPWPSW